jgi:hypothetical protein
MRATHKLFNGCDRLNSQLELEGTKDDEVSLNYRNFNMFTLRFFGRLSYTKQRDAIISVDFDDDDINRTSLPMFNI